MDTPSGTSRRDFLRTTAVATGGLVLAFTIPGSKRFLEGQPPPATPFAPNALLRVAEDDSVTILLSHSEMAQGIWTGLSMLIAEELDADWSKVRVEHAPAAPEYGHTAFGMQMTGGSTTTWSEFDRYRQVGALARELLVATAAERLGVEPSACRVEKGFVTHGGRRLSFGSL